ncbi:hypothetical protein [Spirosoma sordidisoli]|uniref:Uncharacterized protein n=1 Tax=Spirosoma sordidisoli TaxID=2502893 RepID=A0A4Q2UQ66_9BACT|nr:hypothetical protein [Spirosoma sordidisoli]RYC69780.1 hypothetical protein EQG79_14390 [Spirosoma sordidisoli]
MIVTQDKNPLARLMALLPMQVAREKRRAIEADMVAIGKYEHYRQRVIRRDWKMGSTQVDCAAVIMRHLGVTLEFFTGTDEQREEQIETVTKAYYQQAFVGEGVFQPIP